MSASHRRHDIPDRVWERLKPLLPGGEGKVGRPALDNRRFLNGVFWILRTGAHWRDLRQIFQLKQWRAVATRYAKRGASFLATCQIRALVLWTKLF